MRPEGPIAADVDALVRERKYIKELPRVVEGHNEYRMKAVVYSRATRKPTGAVIMATAQKSPTGIPKWFPSAVLEMNGRFRIRGINHALRHDCPNGPIVYGWHEHIWSNQYQDHVVIKARPAPDNPTMSGLFEWGLKKWNIAVGEPKTKGERHGRTK